MEFKLQAVKRAKDEKLSPDYLPAVLYGKGLENQVLKIKKLDFEKVFSAAGESNLINLDYGSGEVKVLVKDIQRDILKYTFTHVDFYQVNMKEKIKAEITLHFVGEAKAVKELGGMLMREIHELEVECLPTDLVDHIDVDISVLKTFDDVIKIKDLILPPNMKLMHHHDEDMVAQVVEPKAEEEVKVAETTEATPVPTPETKDVKKEETKK